MTIEELKKLVDLELQWLRYYVREDSRMKINEDTEIYRDLVSIGYTKRVVKLDRRCSPCVITSDELIDEKTDISKLFKLATIRGENKYSPLEAFLILYPEKKMETLNILKI